MSRAARSDRPLYARNQHLQPGQNRHGVDPAPRFPSRKRDPASVSRHSLRTRRYLRGSGQIRLDPRSSGAGAGPLFEGSPLNCITTRTRRAPDPAQGEAAKQTSWPSSPGQRSLGRDRQPKAPDEVGGQCRQPGMLVWPPRPVSPCALYQFSKPPFLARWQEPMVRRLFAGGRWIRTSSTAAREPGISEASRTSRVALAPVRVVLAAACTAVGDGVANGASRGLRRHRGRG